MKKATTLLTALIFIISCSKKDILKNEPQTSQSIQQAELAGWVGDPNRTPDIKPVNYEIDPDGFPYGVRTTDPIDGLPKIFTGVAFNGQFGTWIRYTCPIENIGVTSANAWSPLVFNSSDGKYSKADFIFQTPIVNPQFLYIVTFQNGWPVSLPADNYKPDWDGGDETYAYNHNNTYSNATFLNLYSGDTAVMHPGYKDTYFNDAKLPDNPIGKFVVVITTNQEDYSTHARLFNEYDYSNNTATLPFNVIGGVPNIDTTALSENVPHPVDSISGTFNGVGKIKTVSVSWVCPYHKFAGLIHKFQVKKDGVIVSDKQWTSNYVDTVRGNFKSATYEVAIEIEGLGISPFKSVTVNR